MSETHIEIDRSNIKAVDKYIHNVFIDFRKKKTQVLLSSYYQWYCRNPQYHNEELGDFDSYIRKNKNDFEQKDKVVKTVYGYKYATMLTKFVRAHRLFANDLMQIARDSVELSKFEGRGNLGFSKLFDDKEIQKLEDAFKLLQVETGKILVLKTNIEEYQKDRVPRAGLEKSQELMKLKKSSKFSDMSDPMTKATRTPKHERKQVIFNLDDCNNPIKIPLKRIQSNSECHDHINNVPDDNANNVDSKEDDDALNNDTKDNDNNLNLSIKTQENEPEAPDTTWTKVATRAVDSSIKNIIKIVYSPKFSIEDLTSDMARIEITHTSTTTPIKENA